MVKRKSLIAIVPWFPMKERSMYSAGRFSIAARVSIWRLCNPPRSSTAPLAPSYHSHTGFRGWYPQDSLSNPINDHCKLTRDKPCLLNIVCSWQNTVRGETEVKRNWFFLCFASIAQCMWRSWSVFQLFFRL